jgi:hypothetical protein
MKFDIWEFFEKTVEEIQVSLKSDQNNVRVLYMKTDIHFLSHIAQFLSEWEMFQTKVVEKIKTHILYSVTFYRKSHRLWDNVEKCCRAGQATDGNMARAHCMLGT